MSSRLSLNWTENQSHPTACAPRAVVPNSWSIHDNPCTGKVVALASPKATGRPFNWARVLKHEVVHVITLQQTEFNIPHWYTEALAVESEGFPRPQEWNKMLLERVPARSKLLNLDTINLGFIRPNEPEDRQMAYCQAQLYAGCLDGIAYQGIGGAVRVPIHGARRADAIALVAGPPQILDGSPTLSPKDLERHFSLSQAPWAQTGPYRRTKAESAGRARSQID